ncbi:MAG TPA: TIGR00159 family protein, partial [Nitrospiria bacterium]|nr:TIGR00159 family protein [Nitrospiria bacterium]
MLELAKNFRWLDLVYILLVGFIVYRLFFLRKATRTLQMMAGLAVLVTALLAAHWLGLFTPDGLVTNFWSQLLLTVLVLFQPEIRRALARIGQILFNYNLTSVEESQTLEEAIRAIVSLAAKKSGAIIVLEREIELKDIVEMGVPLDAKV